MAFTYRGRRGEIKMAIRYPEILNTTSLAVHCAAAVREALKKVPASLPPLPDLHTSLNYACEAQFLDPY